MAPESLWSEADIEILKSGWAKGWTGVQLSLAVGSRHSRNGCIGKANRLGLAPRDNTFNRSHLHRTPVPKPNPPQKPTEAPTEAPPPIGVIGDFPPPGACKWPVKDLPDFQCCGHPVAGSAPYCAFHRQKAYAPSSKPGTHYNRAERQFG